VVKRLVKGQQRTLFAAQIQECADPLSVRIRAGTMAMGGVGGEIWQRYVCEKEGVEVLLVDSNFQSCLPANVVRSHS
jgi:hypothetical protein